MRQYGAQYGEGIPLLYERGVGITNLAARAPSGASVGLGGLQLGFGNGK